MSGTDVVHAGTGVNKIFDKALEFFHKVSAYACAMRCPTITLDPRAADTYFKYAPLSCYAGPMRCSVLIGGSWYPAICPRTMYLMSGTNMCV
eukprot:1408986-Rhodomonas_salina.1